MEQDVAEAIDELSRTVSAHIMQLSVQMIEVQAYVEVLLARDNSRVVAAGQSREAVAQELRTKFEANRTRIFEVVKERFQLAGLNIDGLIQ